MMNAMIDDKLEDGTQSAVSIITLQYHIYTYKICQLSSIGFADPDSLPVDESLMQIVISKSAAKVHLVRDRVPTHSTAERRREEWMGVENGSGMAPEANIGDMHMTRGGGDVPG